MARVMTDVALAIPQRYVDLIMNPDVARFL